MMMIQAQKQHIVVDDDSCHHFNDTYNFAALEGSIEGLKYQAGYPDVNNESKIFKGP